MEQSLTKTLAAKYRSKVPSIYQRYGTWLETPEGRRKGLRVLINCEGKPPLVAEWGGISLARRTDTLLPLQPIPPQKQEQQQLVHQRRQERYQTIHRLIEKGWTQQAIADKLDIDRQTVWRYLKMPQAPLPQRQTRRSSILDPYRAYLLERWAERAKFFTKTCR